MPNNEKLHKIATLSFIRARKLKTSLVLTRNLIFNHQQTLQ